MAEQVFDHEDESKEPLSFCDTVEDGWRPCPPNLAEEITVDGIEGYCTVVGVDSHWLLAKTADGKMVVKASHHDHDGMHENLGVHYQD